MSKNQYPSSNDDKPLHIKQVNPLYEKLMGETYRWNEIVVFYKEKPTESDINEIKESFKEQGIDPSSIEIVQCDNCDIPVQLWKATNIHTLINTEGVKV